MKRLLQSSIVAVTTVVLAGYIQSATYASVMIPGDSLPMGSCLQSDNGAYGLCAVQFFSGGLHGLRWGGVVCNMGLHQWWDTQIDANCSSGYGNHSNQVLDAGTGGVADMQGDGNFVLYSGGGTARWATNTSGFGSGAFLSLQDDGNLVVYYNTNIPVWSIF